MKNRAERQYDLRQILHEQQGAREIVELWRQIAVPAGKARFETLANTLIPQILDAEFPDDDSLR